MLTAGCSCPHPAFSLATGAPARPPRGHGAPLPGTSGIAPTASRVRRPVIARPAGIGRAVGHAAPQPRRPVGARLAPVGHAAALLGRPAPVHAAVGEHALAGRNRPMPARRALVDHGVGHAAPLVLGPMLARRALGGAGLVGHAPPGHSGPVVTPRTPSRRPDQGGPQVTGHRPPGLGRQGPEDNDNQGQRGREPMLHCDFPLQQ